MGIEGITDDITEIIYKKTKSVKGISSAKQKKMGQTSGTPAGGVGGGQNEDPSPFFNAASCEKVLKNAHNASIVLGKDRAGSKLSGFGGRGDTHCAAIDIVAGRMGHKAASVNSNNEPIHADPNFVVDAARIYISQKTNVDRNFRLVKGSQPYADIRSAVAIKADAVRVVGREGIKLVTGCDRINSQGAEINKKAYGIDLIAGNDDSDLQPLVKGDNLHKAMQKLVHHVDKLAAIVDNFAMIQIQWNAHTINHFHVNGPMGPTTVDLLGVPIRMIDMVDMFTKVKLMLLFHKVNLTIYRIQYLTPLGTGWINSFNNNTN